MTIQGLHYDSRCIQPGDMFFALPSAGQKNLSGHSFIPQAIEKGARVVVGDILDHETSIFPKDNDRDAPPDHHSQDVIFVDVPDPRRALAQAAALFYPHYPKTVVGVTGTNGKTSVCHFLKQFWEKLGKKAAALGTCTPWAETDLSLTTPDAITIHKTLTKLSQAAVDAVAMEASSHGLDQHRLTGVQFAAGVFTNFSQDHLDYHGDLQTYLMAKTKLFSELLPPGSPAVLCADVAPVIQETCKTHNVITYGQKGSVLSLENMIPKQGKSHVTLHYGKNTFEGDIPLIGRFQVENVCAALGVLLGLGESWDTLIPHLTSITAVPGRVQKIDNPFVKADVFVDFAHTPKALENVLQSLRPYCRNKLHVVFGCGGNRDTTKRPLMGQVAANLADVVYITDDNPRTEDPNHIYQDILRGCSQAQVIPGRKPAIHSALQQAQRNDIVLVAGKGHETYQIIGETTFPFHDANIIENYKG